jgi:predicted house-cleaning NTP pyrophosphatase (Maf/HAM1 superfamily)
VAFHEHNLLPSSTPESYALLSAESKATEAANNEERLVVCHYIVWCRTVLEKE